MIQNKYKMFSLSGKVYRIAVQVACLFCKLILPYLPQIKITEYLKKPTRKICEAFSFANKIVNLKQ